MGLGRIRTSQLHTEQLKGVIWALITLMTLCRAAFELMATPTGLEPAIFGVTGRRVTLFHHGAIWLREQDSNLRFSAHEADEMAASLSRNMYGF